MLDAASANRVLIARSMGKSRNEQLADHYLEAAGIAGVWFDAGGACGALRVVTCDRQRNCLIYCCETFAQALTLARACTLYPDMPFEQRAEREGIPITAHSRTVARALAAVIVVNRTISEMQGNGGMRELNAAFKVARRADGALRYHDYLHRRKAEMLTAMAREIGR